MIDPRVLRHNPDNLRDSQRRRGADAALVDVLVDLDQHNRARLQEYERLRAEQKTLSKQVGRAKGKAAKAPADSRAELTEQADDLQQRAGRMAGQVRAAEESVAAAKQKLARAWLGIDNLVDEAAPVGDESDFKIIEHVGTPRDFEAEGLSAQDHLELGRSLGIIDTERAAKVSGSRFFYLMGDGALLELALLNLAMGLASGAGLIPVIPPALVGEAAMAGTGFLGQAAENVYRLEADDLYLVGTSEVALAGMHAKEILDHSRLPLRYAGFSPCFRREAGSHGKDTRGIIRVHQFDKVEMFSYCRPEEAAEEHQRLLRWEREFLDLLDIPYRVIDVATGDLGASAARKFDIEAWIPTQQRYREVTSASNCTTFQSRRLNIRYRDEDGRSTPVATLNGTLVAMPRIIVALLENHQMADGRVELPKALRPLMGDRAYLNPR